MRTGPETSLHIGAQPGQRSGDRMALLAGRAVGDVAHRVDRLMRRAGGDDDLPARQRLRPVSSSASMAATISSGSAMRPSPASPLSAISPCAGPTKRDAVLAQRRAVAARGRMRPHLRVHRRRHQHRLVGGEQHGRGEIVGDGRWRASPSGRRWPAPRRSGRLSRDSRIWPTSCSSWRSNRSVKTWSADSAPTDSGVTNSCAAAVITHAHRGAALAQPADQVERLVGGDAAADDEQDALAGEARCAADLARRGSDRRSLRCVRSPVRAGLFDLVDAARRTELAFDRGADHNPCLLLHRAAVLRRSLRSRSLTSSSRLRMVMLAI